MRNSNSIQICSIHTAVVYRVGNAMRSEIARGRKDKGAPSQQDDEWRNSLYPKTQNPKNKIYNGNSAGHKERRALLGKCA